MTKSHSSFRNPAHYTRWKIEPITFLMRNDCEFWRANIPKYAMRAGHKQSPGTTAVESESGETIKVTALINNVTRETTHLMSHQSADTVLLEEEPDG